MIWEDLNENLIVPDLEAENSEEVFEKLGGLFLSLIHISEPTRP